jgi:hypothetical protein
MEACTLIKKAAPAAAPQTASDSEDLVEDSDEYDDEELCAKVQKAARLALRWTCVEADAACRAGVLVSRSLLPPRCTVVEKLQDGASIPAAVQQGSEHESG